MSKRTFKVPAGLRRALTDVLDKTATDCVLNALRKTEGAQFAKHALGVHVLLEVVPPVEGFGAAARGLLKRAGFMELTDKGDGAPRWGRIIRGEESGGRGKRTTAALFTSGK